MPTTPANLTATPTTGQVALTWSAATDEGSITGYRVYRRGTQIATTAGLGFTETGLSGGVRYDYQVASVDNDGNVSTLSATVSATTPKALKSGAPPVIFDADMSSDIDDVGAITALHALADLGECEIIGMGASSTNGGTCEAMDAINTYYGRPDIPVGKAPGTTGPGGYAGTVASNFPHDVSYTTAPPAVTLYRQLLAAADDHSVVIITVGYMANLAGLLASTADGASSLNGSDLIALKVKTWVAMAGRYPSGSEFNFMSSGDGGAGAYALVNNWPTAVTYSGFEIGSVIYSGGTQFIANTPASHPANRAWQSYPIAIGRPSFDQTAVLAAIRLDEGLFDVNNVGRNNANTNGSNFWTTTPDPTGTLEQQYLVEKTRFPVQSAINTLMEAPAAAAPPAVPAAPSNLRATTVTGTSVALAWTRNSHNNTGFTLQRRDNGVWTTIATPAAGVTTHTDSGLSASANTRYRVRADNGLGSSGYATLMVLGGWTETNNSSAGALPLYSVHQNHLTFVAGDATHITVNDGFTHGQVLTVTADVGARDNTGTFYVYLFYQNATNWYRLSVDGTASKFEKSVAGTITQIGTAAAGVSIGGGDKCQPWQIDVTPSSLTFTAPVVTLTVPDTLSFSTGKVGFGGLARRPVWQNVTFAQVADGGGTVTTPFYPGAHPGSIPTTDTDPGSALFTAAADISDVADTVVRTATSARTVTDTTSGADAVTKTLAVARTVTDTAGGTDAVATTVAIGHAVTDAAGIVDATTASAAGQTITVTTTDTVAIEEGGGFGESPLDTTPFGDAHGVTATRAIVRGVQDTAAITDVASRRQVVTRADTAAVTDTVGRAHTIARTVRDLVRVAETGQGGFGSGSYGTFPFGTAALAGRGVSRTVTDSAGLSDATGAQGSGQITASVSDQVTATDRLTRTTSTTRVRNDTTAIDGTAVRAAGLNRSIDDTVAADDTAVGSGALVRSVQDVAAAADLADTGTGHVVELADLAAAVDDLFAELADEFTVTVLDTAAAQDAVVMVLGEVSVVVLVGTPVQTYGGGIRAGEPVQRSGVPRDVSVFA